MTKSEKVNEIYSYLVRLMEGLHNYEKFISYAEKSFKTFPENADTLISNLLKKATSINIANNMWLDYEGVKNAARLRISQNQAIIDWLKEYRNNITKEESKPQKKIIIRNENLWEIMHPIVIELAKERFENGFYADAVLVCLREINSILKNHYKQKSGKELDGASLITTLFSPKTPIISLADLSTENGRNIQLGYMKMFEGMMIGIRNPKSHENMYPDKVKTLHFLHFASFVFIKLDESGLLKTNNK